MIRFYCEGYKKGGTIFLLSADKYIQSYQCNLKLKRMKIP
jgi:hypothetical protein